MGSLPRTSAHLVVTALALATAGLPAAPALAGNPWEDLMGPGKPRTWTDPEGRFSLDLPLGWEAKASTGAASVDFWRDHKDSGFVARVTVEVRTLPPGVSTRHFALKVRDETRRAAPGFRLLGEERRVIGGQEATWTQFVYAERGNAQLQNEVVQVVMVRGERAFLVTLEMALGTREVFLEEFETMLRGFSTGGATTPGEAGRPGSRRKIKSGEMINPDAIGY
jgi:hypothetical protein